MESGYDDLEALITQMQSPCPIKSESLDRIGISKPGHRYRIIIRLEEEAGSSLPVIAARRRLRSGD